MTTRRFSAPQVVLFSADVERAAAFYTSLGFTEAFRTPEKASEDTAESTLESTPGSTEPIHVDVVLDGYRIGLASLASTRDDHGLAPATEPQRAAVVLWTDDVRAAFAELTARGVPGLRAPEPWLDRLLVAWVADPDGHAVQLVQELPGD